MSLGLLRAGLQLKQMNLQEECCKGAGIWDRLLNRMAGAGNARNRFVHLQAACGLEADSAGGSLLTYLNRKDVSSAQGLQPLRRQCFFLFGSRV